MIPFASAIESNFRDQSVDLWEQFVGFPEEDLNEWKPALGLQDINTFYALMTHIISSGEYWTLQPIGVRTVERDRPAEFVATGSLAALKGRFDAWMMDLHDALETLTETDLARTFQHRGHGPVDWSVAECLLHAVEHTATHLGHLQIQRQIWNAEHSAD